jgi:peptide/nickel transport system substrate-binding protein
VAEGRCVGSEAQPALLEGTPAVDEVRIEYVPDDNPRILKLQGGEVDVIDFVPLSQVAAVDALPNITARPFVVQALSNMIINVQKKPLDDVKIRQALNYATDKEAIIKNVYFGQAKFQNSPIPPGMYWDKDLPGYPYDLEKAKQLMKESSAPDGFTVEMQVRAGNTEYQNNATIVKDQWAKIGVNVNLVTLETSLVRTNYREGNYEIMPIGFSNDMNDPTQVVNFMMKGDASPWAYWTHWDDPALDAKIAQADVEMDPKVRETLYKEIQKTFLDAIPQILLVYRPDTAAWQDYVEGFAIEGLSYYRFENVKINK